jgi:hypothetical protein
MRTKIVTASAAACPGKNIVRDEESGLKVALVIRVVLPLGMLAAAATLAQAGLFSDLSTADQNKKRSTAIRGRVCASIK